MALDVSVLQIKNASPINAYNRLVLVIVLANYHLLKPMDVLVLQDKIALQVNAKEEDLSIVLQHVLTVMPLENSVTNVSAHSIRNVLLIIV